VDSFDPWFSIGGSMTLPLVVLAAGMGSRYGGLEQIDPMGPAGETVLGYTVRGGRILLWFYPRLSA
jgi:predicted dienelactone hydrolase